MAISEYFQDDELISELRMFVDLDDEDLKACLGTITELDDGDTMELRILNRKFQFSKTMMGVEEVGVFSQLKISTAHFTNMGK